METPLRSVVIIRARNTNSSTTGAMIKTERIKAIMLFSMSSDIPPVSAGEIGATAWSILENAEKQNAAMTGSRYFFAGTVFKPYVFFKSIFFYPEQEQNKKQVYGLRCAAD